MEIRIYSEELRGPAAPGKEKQAQIKHLQKELLRKALRDTGIYFAEQEELPQVLHTATGRTAAGPAYSVRKAIFSVPSGFSL